MVFLVVLGGIVIAGVLAVGYAMLRLSGDISQAEREEYYRQTGRWPEW